MGKSMDRNEPGGFGSAGTSALDAKTLGQYGGSEGATEQIEKVRQFLEEIAETIRDLESSATLIIKETAVAHVVADRLNLLVFNGAVETRRLHESNLESLSERIKGFAECTMATTYVLSGSMEAAAETVATSARRLAALEGSLAYLKNATRYLAQKADVVAADLYGKSAA